ncbi:MAG TPA: ribosome maturation factor RimM [Blastocatellia bacterium]|nr:ribosome maturation factor RimM [Blastocatellia bacterium]
MKEELEIDELISIARIVRPQGRHGEVVAELLTDFPDRFAKLDRVQMRRSDGRISVVALERFWLHKGRIVLKLGGCDSINQAEELRGSQIMVPRAQLVSLPQDSYYDFDLVGCAVMTVDGRPLGSVIEVQQYGAAPLLVVKDANARELLIPLALSICVEIDVGSKRIVVNPPEGLLELV